MDCMAHDIHIFTYLLEPKHEIMVLIENGKIILFKRPCSRIKRGWSSECWSEPSSAYVLCERDKAIARIGGSASSSEQPLLADVVNTKLSYLSRLLAIGALILHHHDILSAVMIQLLQHVSFSEISKNKCAYMLGGSVRIQFH